MGYTDALEGLGLEIVEEYTTGDYQGDLVILGKDPSSYPDTFYLLVIGYGSCSGCDAWEAAEATSNPLQAKAEVVSVLVEGAKPFDSWDALLDHLEGLDKANEWWLNEETGEHWRQQVLARRRTPEGGTE